MEFIDIGGSPAGESCAALGITEGFDRLNRLECHAYMAALQKVHGPAPSGSQFSVHANRHDFGVYREVRFHFDPENEEHYAYMNKVENGLDRWDEADFWAPVKYDAKSQPFSIISDLGLLDRTRNPKAFPTRAAFEANTAELLPG
jgi:hypothetical protein